MKTITRFVLCFLIGVTGTLSAQSVTYQDAYLRGMTGLFDKHILVSSGISRYDLTVENRAEMFKFEHVKVNCRTLYVNLDLGINWIGKYNLFLETSDGFNPKHDENEAGYSSLALSFFNIELGQSAYLSLRYVNTYTRAEGVTFHPFSWFKRDANTGETLGEYYSHVLSIESQKYILEWYGAGLGIITGYASLYVEDRTYKGYEEVAQHVVDFTKEEKELLYGFYLGVNFNAGIFYSTLDLDFNTDIGNIFGEAGVCYWFGEMVNCRLYTKGIMMYQPGYVSGDMRYIEKDTIASSGFSLALLL